MLIGALITLFYGLVAMIGAMSALVLVVSIGRAFR